MEIEQNTIGYEEAINGEYRPSVPVVIYSLGFDAEQLLTVYRALMMYLKTLGQQENQDFRAIKRIAEMMIQINPRAVEASKSLAQRTIAGSEQ